MLEIYLVMIYFPNQMLKINLDTSSALGAVRVCACVCSGEREGWHKKIKKYECTSIKKLTRGYMALNGHLPISI
jgi:hypothetical protein